MDYRQIKQNYAQKLAKRKGAGGLLAVLGVAVAVAVIVFPLARWHASLTNSASGLKEGLENTSLRLEMLSAMEDRWHQINDMDVAEFKALTSDKETQYGKFTVKESFGAVGKYNSSTGKCDEGTPGDGDRACRVATLTVISEDGESTIGPVQAIRVASSDDRLRKLEANIESLSKKVEDGGNGFPDYSRAQKVNLSGGYYTAPQNGFIFTFYLGGSEHRWQRIILGRVSLGNIGDPNCYDGHDITFFPVSKGDRVYINYREIYFIPVKNNL